MDINLLEVLQTYVQIPSFIACLCIGYVIKNTKLFEKWSNGLIPLYLAIFGIVFAIAANWGTVNVTVIIAGMFSGLASSGFYDLFVAIVERKKNDPE